MGDWAAMPFSSNFRPFTKPNRGEVYRLYLTKKNPQKSRRRILSFFLFLGSVAFHMAVMVVLTKYFNLFLNDDWLLNFHDINLFMSKHSVRATTTIIIINSTHARTTFARERRWWCLLPAIPKFHLTIECQWILCPLLNVYPTWFARFPITVGCCTCRPPPCPTISVAAAAAFSSVAFFFFFALPSFW